MAAIKAYYMHCDLCGYDDEPIDGRRNAAAVRRIGLADGWTRRRANHRSQMRIDLCPTCSESEG